MTAPVGLEAIDCASLRVSDNETRAEGELRGEREIKGEIVDDKDGDRLDVTDAWLSDGPPLGVRVRSGLQD